MYYMKYDNVQLTANGFPICHLDSKTCDVENCHYHLFSPRLGNCVLRIPDEIDGEMETFEALSVALGEGGRKVSRQRIDQIEKRALRKLRENWGEVLKEELRK